MPPNNSGNRERTPLSTRSPRLARLTKSKLPPPKSKSIPQPESECQKCISGALALGTSIGLSAHARVGKGVEDLSIPGKPQLPCPVVPEGGFKFRVQVSNYLGRPAGQSPVNMDRATGRFPVVVCEGASEFEPNCFVMR